MSIENILNISQLSLDTSMLQQQINALNIANTNNKNAKTHTLDFTAVLEQATNILNTQGLESAELFIQNQDFVKQTNEKIKLADLMASNSENLMRYKAVSQSTGQILNLYQIAIKGGK